MAYAKWIPHVLENCSTSKMPVFVCCKRWGLDLVNDSNGAADTAQEASIPSGHIVSGAVGKGGSGILASFGCWATTLLARPRITRTRTRSRAL